MSNAPEITDESSPKPKRRYDWWMFFAVVVMLVALALTFLVPAYRQLALIERIETLGGRVESESVGPAWLRSFVGAERMRGFDDVVYVALHTELKIDGLMEEIARLTHLEYLDLLLANVSDADLVHLKELDNLERLILVGTQITDDGLMHLEGLVELDELLLNETRVSDAGLSHLRGLTDLKLLGLNYTQISDDGLVHLKRLTDLKELWLRRTQVTEQGVSELRAALPGCEIILSDM